MEVETGGRVLFRDTDAGGVMYFGNYSSLIEQGYSEWFRQHEMPLLELLKTYQIYFLVYNLNIKYLLPLHYDEIFKIQTRLVKMHKITLFFEINILNQMEREVAQAHVEKVCYSSTKKNIVHIPERLIQPLTKGLSV